MTITEAGREAERAERGQQGRLNVSPNQGEGQQGEARDEGKEAAIATPVC